MEEQKLNALDVICSLFAIGAITALGARWMNFMIDEVIPAYGDAIGKKILDIKKKRSKYASVETE